jgi:hypothetical protein
MGTKEYGVTSREFRFTPKETHWTRSGPHTLWLTLSLLMSYTYMELLVKPEILTSYIYGPTSGNDESRLFLFAAQCFNTESMQKVFLWHSCV